MTTAPTELKPCQCGAAIIAGLRAEVERLQECAATWEHNWQSERDLKLDYVSHVKAATARAEAAEARVKELEATLEELACRHVTIDPLWWQVKARAALASKKETVDE